ncbi:MAG: hypothetical protein HYY23_04320 [Verrucomicrobia bacterium]|nr:hypothetical protein [Verrucomicrobiota bacterium]
MQTIKRRKHKVQWLALLGMAIGLGMAPAARAQVRPYIGYVYPAGAQQGTTLQIRLGGQGLDDVNEMLVTGSGVTAKVVEYRRRLNNQELQLLNEQLRALRRAAAASKAEKATANRVAQASSPPSSAGVPPVNSAGGEKPPELAAETAEQRIQSTQKLIARIEKRTREFVQTPACASISSLVLVEVTVAPDAEPGAREIRLATFRGVSNPLAFHVGQVPEFSRKPMLTAMVQVLGKEAQSLRKRPADEAEDRITIPCSVNGQIASGEVNRYRFEARQGERLVISTLARQLIPYIADAVPGWFQPVLALYDVKGKEVAFDDDYRFKPDPVILYEVPQDGEYVLTIHDSIYRGREDFVYRIALGELPFVTSLFPLGMQVGSSAIPIMKGWNLQGAEWTLVHESRHPLTRPPESSGVRPSPGAELPDAAGAFDKTDAPERADVAAAEDGRTPLNRFSPTGEAGSVKEGTSDSTAHNESGGFVPKDAEPGIHPLAASRNGFVSAPVPFVLDTLPDGLEKEPNNSQAGAQLVTLPVMVNGRIDKADDWDVFQFTGKSNEMVAVEVQARRLDSPLDSVIKLTDATGTLLAFSDDREDLGAGVNTHQADSWFIAKLPADGAYFVHIGDTAREGGEEYGYRLRISAPQPDFALRVVPSSVSFRSRSTAAVSVYAIRKDGFTGPIKLGLKDPPAGFSAWPVTLSGTQVVARLTIKTDLVATKEPLSLSIAGSAKIGQKEIAHRAVPAEDRMQAFLWRHLVPASNLKVLVFDPINPPPPKRAAPARPPSAITTNMTVGTNATVSVTVPTGTNAATAATAPKPKFTRQQIAGRLRQLKLLFEEGLLTDDFYNEKVAECEAAQ